MSLRAIQSWDLRRKRMLFVDVIFPTAQASERSTLTGSGERPPAKPRLLFVRAPAQAARPALPGSQIAR